MIGQRSGEGGAGVDANGNTTSVGNREFVYDASGRMSQAKVNGVVEMNSAYKRNEPG